MKEKVEERIYGSTRLSDYGTLKNLIEYHGADPITLNKALDIACHNKNLKIAKFLIDRGAQLNAITEASIYSLLKGEPNYQFVDFLVMNDFDKEVIDRQLPHASKSSEWAVARSRRHKFMEDVAKELDKQRRDSQ